MSSSKDLIHSIADKMASELANVKNSKDIFTTPQFPLNIAQEFLEKNDFGQAREYIWQAVVASIRMLANAFGMEISKKSDRGLRGVVEFLDQFSTLGYDEHLKVSKFFLYFNLAQWGPNGFFANSADCANAIEDIINNKTVEFIRELGNIYNDEEKRGKVREKLEKFKQNCMDTELTAVNFTQIDGLATSSSDNINCSEASQLASIQSPKTLDAIHRCPSPQSLLDHAKYYFTKMDNAKPKEFFDKNDYYKAAYKQWDALVLAIRIFAAPFGVEMPYPDDRDNEDVAAASVFVKFFEQFSSLEYEERKTLDEESFELLFGNESKFYRCYRSAENAIPTYPMGPNPDRIESCIKKSTAEFIQELGNIYNDEEKREKVREKMEEFKQICAQKKLKVK